MGICWHRGHEGLRQALLADRIYRAYRSVGERQSRDSAVPGTTGTKMRVTRLQWTILLVCFSALLTDTVVHGSDLPPRIDSVGMLYPQPHASDPAVIWYDDFTQARAYGESQNGIDYSTGYGGRGGALPMTYRAGTLGAGNRKLFFGDSPDRRNIVRPGEHFRDVYWRFYVKHQHGWTGGSPAKMSRVTSLVSSTWQQGMIAHLWDGGQSLMIDPATGIRDGQVVTTRYNDFDSLDWMRARARASFPIHSTAESGYWVPVEARARLNDPGRQNGVFRLWINDRLEAELTGLDWHGDYIGHGINAVFLEAYWNDRSPVDQTRWFDNFVVSTERIGPIYAPRNPVLHKSVPPGDAAGTWQVEVGRANGDQLETVWRSDALANIASVRTDTVSGRFSNGEQRLGAGATFYVRVRHLEPGGHWSSWSHWHQPFRTPEMDCATCPMPPVLDESG
jgi:hypothetical protein